MAERLLELDPGWTPEPGSPMPVLWQTDERSVLIFTEARSDRRIMVEFEACLVAQFGYPNDEALSGHPLYPLGLKPYGVFEVSNSSWLLRVTRQNRVAFPGTSFDDLRHFIITLHDSTFECLARSLSAREVDEATEASIIASTRGESV